MAGNVALAGTATIALTGSGGVPGVSGASFGAFSVLPVVNNNGNVAFFATMQDGVGGVNGNSNGNAQGIWGPDSAGNLILIARQNSGGVPGQPGNNFSNINTLYFLNDNGGVGFTSQTTTNVVGIWASDSTGNLSQITSGSSVPGMSGAQYQGGINLQAFNNSGKVVFNATLATGFGGVTTGNQSGLWGPDSSGNLVLLARQGVGGVPGVPGANFDSTVAYYPVLDAGGHAAFVGNLQVGVGGVTSSSNQGIWGPDASGNLGLIARTGSGNVPGVPGAGFSGFNFDYVDIANGKVAFAAGLQTGVGGVTSANSAGVWATDASGNLSLIARTGSGAVPGVAGASFSSMVQPQINTADEVAFFGTMQSGIAGVTSSNDTALWGPNPSGNLTLIAREGSGGVPGVAGANFGNFFLTAAALNGNGNVVFRGNLQTGVGGITSSSNLGIWIGDGSELLQVARTGGSLAGRTINDLNLNNGTGGDDGHQSSVNNFGQVAYYAGFTDGNSGMFLYTPDLHWRTSGSGANTWDNRLKWTLSLNPAFVHDTFLDPATNVTMTGPAENSTVKTLTIGGGTGTAELQMQPGVSLAANSVKITTNGTISSSAGATAATLAAPVDLGAGTRTFTVADGAAAVDLAVTGNVSNGSLVKSGAGTLQLQGASNSQATTTVLNGVVSVTGTLANNGSGKVLVAANPAGNFSTPGPTITRSVAVAGSYAGYGSSITSDLLTTADIRAGINSSGVDNGLSMQWRAKDANNLLSDTLNLMGMVNSEFAAGQTDPFALQMTYSPSGNGPVQLDWLNPNGNQPNWQNAVSENFLVGTSVFTNVPSSWDTFASLHGVTDGNLGNFLGSWGVDTTNHIAWAVMDHNSQFAVAAPEPSTFILGALGLLGLGVVARRKKNCVA